MGRGRWFAAALVLEADQPGEGDERTPLFEKRVVLFEAGDESEATTKASDYCRAAGFSYQNLNGQSVVWKCRRILGITPLYATDLGDGVEVYSELLHSDPGASEDSDPDRPRSHDASSV